MGATAIGAARPYRHQSWAVMVVGPQSTLRESVNYSFQYRRAKKQ